MKQFALKPTVQLFDTFAKFIEAVQPGPKDCIFTVKFLADTRFRPLNLESAILQFEDYGAGEPTDEMVDAILADFRKLDCERVIAVGGGSVIDIGKLLTLKATGKTLDFFQKTVEIAKDKELLLVPTTCGTGSEVTNIAIAGIPSKGTKMGLAVDALYADKAILVPELIHGLPEYVFVTSSLDALIHALESFVAPRSNLYAELFSMGAIRTILDGYKVFLREGRKATIPRLARSMMIASNYAGVAFGNTGVGAVHALSYPLGGVHHVPHGEANARLLSAVFGAYLAKDPTGRIRELSALISTTLEVPPWQDPWQALGQVIDLLLPAKPLREYGMLESEIESFADGVIENQQRLLVNNYVTLSRDEIRDIYRNLW
ncbi:MAG: 4-hydroxybutyrate dehydrogenase [Fibrobacteria bacterium]|nr:4-hydroxybutyrate dehydrogenase [Fibrobacteria bacterium]